MRHLALCRGTGAMGYSFLVQLFTLPLANFIIALLMGLDKSWKERQWWLLLYFGFGFFLMQYGTLLPGQYALQREL